MYDALFYAHTVQSNVVNHVMTQEALEEIPRKFRTALLMLLMSFDVKHGMTYGRQNPGR